MTKKRKKTNIKQMPGIRDIEFSISVKEGSQVLDRARIKKKGIRGFLDKWL